MPNEKKQYIDIGDVYFFSGESEVWTVLGSCVSILLYSVNQKCGVICHAQLPAPFRGECTVEACGACAASAQCVQSENRFLICAFREMMYQLDKRKIARSSLEACVFGGANVLIGLSGTKPTIGDRNVELALALLQKHNIRIVEKAVGGTQGYRVSFDNGLRMATVHRTTSIPVVS